MYETALLQRYCASLGITLEKEYKFCKARRFRADYAIPEWRLLLEIEGGAFNRGRHFRGTGAIKDMEKYNLAAVEGWQLLRCTPQEFCKTQMTNWLEKWRQKRLVKANTN